MGWVPRESGWRHALHPGLGVLMTMSPFPTSQPPLPVQGSGTERGRLPRGLLHAPFPANRPLALPPLVTLRKPRKVLLLRRPSGRGLRASRLSPSAQPSRPAPTRNYLLAFSPVQVVGPLPQVQGSQRQRPPATRRAAALIPRAAGAPRADLGAESGIAQGWADHGARGGPRRRAATPPAAAAAPPPSAGANPRRRARPARRGPRVSFRPEGGALDAHSAPPAAGLRAPEPRARGARVGSRWVWEALLYQPGSAPFLQGDSVPALSGAAVCLIYTPLSAFSSAPHPSQQGRGQRNLRPSVFFMRLFVFS